MALFLRQPADQLQILDQSRPSVPLWQAAFAYLHSNSQGLLIVAPSEIIP